ncbi:MAG: hypothetical protein JO022_21300 [Acidobacteriaceae bacterium]|nr:hypothetical protein [Acidobacteriaceae bacterium]
MEVGRTRKRISMVVDVICMEKMPDGTYRNPPSPPASPITDRSGEEFTSTPGIRRIAAALGLSPTSSPPSISNPKSTDVAIRYYETSTGAY